MAAVLMQCGDAANAECGAAHFGLAPNHPSCVIHAVSKAACTPTASPSLEGRQARCSERCKLRPSDLELAFFEYRGEGSAAAARNCKNCGYYEVAHETQDGRPRNRNVCQGFVPHGAYEFDSYYCGCHGWD